MKSIQKVGIVEKVLNHFGYYKPVEKKTRKPRTPRAKNPELTHAHDAGTTGLDVGPLT